MCKVAQQIVSGLNVRSSRYKNKSMIVSDYAIWPILIFLSICIKHTFYLHQFHYYQVEQE